MAFDGGHVLGASCLMNSMCNTGFCSPNTYTCENPVVNGPCRMLETNVDPCPKGYICNGYSQLCTLVDTKAQRILCRQQYDCAASEFCEATSRLCAPRLRVGMPCPAEPPNICDDGLACFKGRCRVICRTSADCERDVRSGLVPCATNSLSQDVGVCVRVNAKSILTPDLMRHTEDSGDSDKDLKDSSDDSSDENDDAPSETEDESHTHKLVADPSNSTIPGGDVSKDEGSVRIGVLTIVLCVVLLLSLATGVVIAVRIRRTRRDRGVILAASPYM